VLHEARWKYRTQNVAKNRHLGTIAQICRAISSQLRHLSTTGKNLLSSNMSSRCPHNMVNFGPLATEIGLPVWGTPANFNGFRLLVALLHGSQVVGSAKLCGIEQRAPPMLGRATIMFGIGPHSSSCLQSKDLSFFQCIGSKLSEALIVCDMRPYSMITVNRFHWH